MPRSKRTPANIDVALSTVTPRHELVAVTKKKPKSLNESRVRTRSVDKKVKECRLSVKRKSDSGLTLPQFLAQTTGAIGRHSEDEKAKSEYGYGTEKEINVDTILKNLADTDMTLSEPGSANPIIAKQLPIPSVLLIPPSLPNSQVLTSRFPRVAIRDLKDQDAVAVPPTPLVLLSSLNSTIPIPINANNQDVDYMMTSPTPRQGHFGTLRQSDISAKADSSLLNSDQSQWNEWMANQMSVNSHAPGRSAFVDYRSDSRASDANSFVSSVNEYHGDFNEHDPVSPQAKYFNIMSGNGLRSAPQPTWPDQDSTAFLTDSFNYQNPGAILDPMQADPSNIFTAFQRLDPNDRN